MKKYILMAVLFAHGILAGADDNHDHGRPFTPEEEDAYFAPFESGLFRKRRFPYRNWNECSQPMSGNYNGYTCTSKRKISEILYEFLDDHIADCITDAAEEMGKTVESYHLVHKGIYGDRRHSPRSLHAEGRAIDIKSIKFTEPNGTTHEMNYSKSGDGAFFTKLRFCWGIAIERYNGCPLYRGMHGRTGSIGKENRDHRAHLHLSVPYCVSDSYAGAFYRR
ncbi:MAG: hypothetical protein K9K67_14060 [Bacteriovoracaceae bacterium]|nr:hypothetical protein [Bacteriovoracaceae bacterium]